MSALVARDLAPQINEAHTHAQRHLMSAVQNAARCGELLAQAKQSLVLPGGWQRWLGLIDLRC